MSSIISIIIVCGLFAVLIIGWLMIVLQPNKWLPPGRNNPSPYGHGEKPKPPANPPAVPATRIEIQRRAQESVDSLAPHDSGRSRDVMQRAL